MTEAGERRFKGWTMAPSDATGRRCDSAETSAPEGSFPSSNSEWTGSSPPDFPTASARPAPALHAIPANVAVLDGRGQIVAANEAWHRKATATGRTSTFLPGLIEETLLGSSDEEGRPAALLDALLTGAVDSYEMEYPPMGRPGNAGTG